MMIIAFSVGVIGGLYAGWWERRPKKLMHCERCGETLKSKKGEWTHKICGGKFVFGPGKKYYFGFGGHFPNWDEIWSGVLGVPALVGFFGGLILLVIINVWAAYQPSEADLLAMWEKKRTEEQAQIAQQQAKDKADKEKAFYDEKFSDFQSKEGRRIQAAITDLEILKEGLEERIESLTILIEQSGRDPEKDEDLIKWKKKLSDLQNSISELDKSLKDAFLAYQKFKLAATEGEQEAFEQAVETGSADAQEIVGRYDELKQQLSGEKEED